MKTEIHGGFPLSEKPSYRVEQALCEVRRLHRNRRVYQTSVFMTVIALGLISLLLVRYALVFKGGKSKRSNRNFSR